MFSRVKNKATANGSAGHVLVPEFVLEITNKIRKKITDRRFRPEFPAVSTNHRPRFPPLGYFPENGGNGARGAEFSREIRVLFLHSFMDQQRLAGVVYQESGSGALDFPQCLLGVGVGDHGMDP